MAKLKILTEDELKQIFGPIDTLKPLHQGSFNLTLMIDSVTFLDPLK